MVIKISAKGKRSELVSSPSSRNQRFLENKLVLKEITDIECAQEAHKQGTATVRKSGAREASSGKSVRRKASEETRGNRALGRDCGIGTRVDV